MDELQVPISDSAFYLSYYYDVVRAPSLWEGLQRLLRDSRSEAPDEVNALHKFNVVPELILACLQRLGGGSAFAFYVAAVVLFTALGSAGLALTSGLLGGSPLCSLAAGSLYFALCFSPSMQAASRLGGAAIALREFWGVPALLLQNGWLSMALVAPARKGAPLGRLLGCAVGTCVLELFWQFAPFVLLLQLLAVLAAHTLGTLPRRRLGEVGLAAMLGTVAALTLSFGNRMLLCSPFFALAGSTAVVGLVPLSPGLAAKEGLFFESAWVLVSALIFGIVAQQSLAQVASEQEDRHVMQLLLQKLGMAPPEASFDAFLYLQAPEFQFLSMSYVHEALDSLALPAAGLATLLVAATWLRSLVCNRKHSSKPSFEEESRAAKQSAWLVQVLFLSALLLLAGLVSRLRVLAAPALCLVGSLSASPDLWAAALGVGARRSWAALLLGNSLGLVLLCTPFMSGFRIPGPSSPVQRAQQVGEVAADLDMRELVEWANESLPSGSLVMADMTLAAKLRMISPTISVGNHPQYESQTSRQRNRDYYRTFTCAAPSTVHEVLSKYGVTHVLLNANACRARMGKLDAFHERQDRCGQLSQAELQQRTFCWGGFLTSPPESDGNALFELAFRNPVYTVLRLGPSRATWASEKKRRRRGPSAQWTAAASWRDWLKGLRGLKAARGLARAGATWPKRHGGSSEALEVAEAFLQAAERLAPGDPMVDLQRAEMQQMSGDAKHAFDGMLDAAQRAEGLDPAALNQVFQALKRPLNEQGPQASLARLKKLVAALVPHWEATHNAFELCDVASWLKDWGDQKLSRKLWAAAKRIDGYDACVREDWSKWEGKEMLSHETWRAFLRM
ncbi:unnamed protein product [Polarella glacialis]|uniref:Mannosyltransferase n=1 Tax=Polarella glacialis TaxID=89957 RepID=A0A813G826_POLGL|nr:unnamed protein product [Polarella glacialis]